MYFKILTFINLVLVLTISVNSDVQAQFAPIGIIFDKHSSDIQTAFRFALDTCKKTKICRGLEVQAYVDIISTADAFKLARLVCNQFGRGVVSLMGYVNPDSFDILHSYTNTFQMPFVNPFFPERVIPPTSGLVDHSISLRPDYHKAIIDTVKFYGWESVIYMYDSHDGLLRLQKIFQTLQPGNADFKITHVKRISNASEATAFLRQIEKEDRWSNKYVLLDASEQLAKQVIIEHVRDVQLGRRNFHYLMTGLIMDDVWDATVSEFGSINITGFRIIDLTRAKAREIMAAWYNDMGDAPMSAPAALMFDAALVLMDSLARFIRKRPEAFKEHIERMIARNGSKMFECIPSKGQTIVPYEPGDKILRMIKKTDLEGLTGTLRFNDRTQRTNFTLQVVEMTPEGRTMKVATWSDLRGLRAYRYRIRPLNTTLKINRNRTYAVSSIIQSPYLMKDAVEVAEQDRFVGFCKDLIDMVAQKLEINYEIRLPKDGKYGEVNTDIAGGWNGMMGELVRKETDMIIAPMQITTERVKSVDFGRPFLSVDYRPIKKTDRPSNIFGFMNPLSKELWICILLSVVVVSLVLFLVSRFSPLEWRVISTEEDESTDNEDTTNKPTVINDFSFWNSMWFSIGSFMQQGSEFFPRSVSGRIVTTVWWFFAMIVVATYTANLASILIYERIAESPKKNSECSNRVPFTTQAKSSHNEAKNEIYYNTEVEAQSWFSSLLDRTFDISTPDVQKDNTCDMVVTVSSSGLKNYAVAFSKGSPLRAPVNIAIQSLKDDGEMDKLITRWFAKPECDVVDENIQGNELALNQIAGLFYVLLGGLIVAIIVAVWDFCRHGKAEAARANVSLRAAFKAKSRAPKKEERKEQSRTPTQDSDHEHDWNEGAYGGYYSPATQIRQEAISLQHGFSQV